MTTATEIVNRALSATGTRSTVANLGEKSNEAAQARLLYEPTRKALLRAAHWNFARRTAYLSLLKAAPGTPENTASATSWSPLYPAPPWLYSYAYPDDCLQLRFVQPQLQVGSGYSPGPGFYGSASLASPSIGALGQRFQVATDTDQGGNRITVILSDASDAIAVYTCDVDNPGLWDGLFQEAMVDALAARLVMALTGDKTLFRLRAQAAMGSIEQARAADGNEGLTIQDHVPDWLRARGYAGDYTTPAEGFYGGWITPSFLLV